MKRIKGCKCDGLPRNACNIHAREKVWTSSCGVCDRCKDGYVCVERIKEERNDEVGKIASDVVDNFLSILEPWFHSDEMWGKINNLADEFLYEDVVRRLSEYEILLRLRN